LASPVALLNERRYIEVTELSMLLDVGPPM
jgi:hypothetical protein